MSAFSWLARKKYSKGFQDFEVHTICCSPVAFRVDLVTHIQFHLMAAQKRYEDIKMLGTKVGETEEE